MKIISQLNKAKTCQNAGISTKIIELNKDIFEKKIISNSFNHCIDEGEFLYELKRADVIPVHKKDKCVKENYRPVSTLTNISRVHKKLLYNQLYSYFDSILCPNQCSFRKGHSAQQFLLVMIEKFNESIDKGHQFGALPTDLLKAFDCIDHKAILVWNFTFIN